MINLNHRTSTRRAYSTRRTATEAVASAEVTSLRTTRTGIYEGRVCTFDLDLSLGASLGCGGWVGTSSIKGMRSEGDAELRMQEGCDLRGSLVQILIEIDTYWLMLSTSRCTSAHTAVYMTFSRYWRELCSIESFASTSWISVTNAPSLSIMLFLPSFRCRSNLQT